jgi:membrane fusion protein (multidrug efflux system)
VAQGFRGMPPRSELESMVRLWGCVTVVCLLVVYGSDRALSEVKGSARVQVADPRRGSVNDLIIGYGIVESENILTRSFQRDGQVSDVLVEVGDQFKKGDPLLNFGASPAAVVAYEQAKTALRLAQGTRDRTKRMFDLKLATRDQLETAEKGVSDAQLTKEMYEKLGSTESEILEAPFDGVVTAISVSKGDRVASGAPLMTLAETAKVRLSVGIEPSELSKIKPGQSATLEPVLPDRKPIETKVKGVGGAIDPKTKLLPVSIDLSNAHAIPGESFKVAILAGQFEGWVVPRDSVGFDKKGPFVFQVDDEHAKKISVNIVGSVDDTSVVDGDIDPQKKMVLVGNYQIADGDALRTEEAVAAAPIDNGQQAVQGRESRD